MHTQSKTHRYRGRCQCGSVDYQLILPKPLQEYTPRACDCDFCQERHAQYVSDSNGRLDVNCNDPVKVLTQGSGQANFLCCPHCEELIAVSCAFKIGGHPQTLGTLNLSRAQQARLQPTVSLNEATTVSPRQLSADEKFSRWQNVWMPLTLTENY